MAVRHFRNNFKIVGTNMSQYVSRSFSDNTEAIHSLSNQIFDKNLIESYIACLPSGKAPGESQIQNELLKICQVEAAQLLAIIFKFSFLH